MLYLTFYLICFLLILLYFSMLCLMYISVFILKDNPPYFRSLQPFNPFPQCFVSTSAASCLLWPSPPVKFYRLRRGAAAESWWVTESGTVSRTGPVSVVCSALRSFILAVYVEGREIPPPLPHHWPSPAEPRNSIQKLRYLKPPRFTTVRTWLLEQIKSSDVTRLCRINIGSQKNR